MKKQLSFYKKNLLFLAIFLTFSFAINPTKEIDLNIIKIYIPFIFILWFLTSLKNKKIILDYRPRFFLLSFFTLTVILSYFWTSDHQTAIRKILFFSATLPLYFTFYQAQKSKKFLNQFLKYLFFGGVLQAILAIFIFSTQFLIKLNLILNILRTYWSPFFLGHSLSTLVNQYSSWLVNISGKTILRSFGTFPDPHLFSLFLALLLPIGFYLQKLKQKTKARNYFYLNKYFLGNLIILFSILTSFSRGAFLSIIAGGLFLFVFSNPVKIIKKKFTLFYVITILLVLLTIIPNPLFSRLKSSLNFQENSNNGRIEMWKTAIQNIKKHPITGTGLGSFGSQLNNSFGVRNPIYAHNLFLDFGSETGILNMVMLLLLSISPILFFINKKNALKKSNLLLSKYIAVSFVIFFIHSLFETPFFSVRVFPLFLILLAIETNYRSPKTISN